jgi:cation diffusion facilitator family transporter
MDRARQSTSADRAVDGETGEDRRTVLIALVANAVIAVVKLAGGLASGSSALLAEAAHSVADTVNQGFLLGSIALSSRAPDEGQPFGHGRQRFLWTFLAAIGMFVAGAIFAFGYGAHQLLAGGEEDGGFPVAWATLVIAAVAEGASWVRAVRQTRAQARAAGRPLLRYVRDSRDPTVKMVLFEDSAALVGVAIAAAGIGLHQVTGNAAFDALASMAIGVMLVVVAVAMARASAGLLVGASARPEERAAIEEVLEAHPLINRVNELLTMVLGPRALLVAARVDLDDQADGARIEQAANELERAVRDAVPDVTEVFLDATPGERS